MAYVRKRRSPKRSAAKRTRRTSSRPAGKLTAIHIYLTGSGSPKVRSSTKRTTRRTVRHRR